MSEQQGAGTKTGQFKKWLTDVLFYHYKWAIIGVLAVIGAAVWLIAVSRSKTKPDFTVMLVTTQEADSYAVNSLETVFGEVLGDVNGDGVTYVSVTQYTLGDISGGNQIVYSASSAVAASFMNNDITLYLFDKAAFDTYNIDDGRFNEELGRLYGGEGAAVNASEFSIFREIGFTEEYPLFFAFKGKTYAFEKSGLTEAEFYKTARALLDGLTERYGRSE